jgi:outer membrane protein W
VRRISRYLPLLFVLPCCVPLASAQSQFDLNIGFGAIHDGANSTQVDQNLNPCTTAGGYVPFEPCVSTSSLSGFTLGIGGDLMLKKKFGFGAEVAFEPGKQTYIPNLSAIAAENDLTSFAIQSRMTLYDFNGIFQPISTKKFQVKLQAGIGGANLKFYENTASTSVLGNQNESQYAQSANHLNVHGGVGVDIFVTDHIYIRPEFDVHYVPNLTQYSSNVILEGIVWVGYSWGDR